MIVCSDISYTVLCTVDMSLTSSIGTGAIFSPPFVIIISFDRPVMKQKPIERERVGGRKIKNKSLLQLKVCYSYYVTRSDANKIWYIRTVPL